MTGANIGETGPAGTNCRAGFLVAGSGGRRECGMGGWWLVEGWGKGVV